MTDAYRTADDKVQALHDAEAASRRAESEANILRGRSNRARDPAALESTLQEKIEAGRKAQEELDAIHATGVQQDLSGMSRGLSDSAGNFAPNAEVMKAGGIGVGASNTNVETGGPATTADQAGVVIDPALAAGAGDGGGASATKKRRAPKKGRARKSKAKKQPATDDPS